jgi:hypothetical protein
MTTLQDITRRVQQALATASNSLSSLVRRSTTQAFNALSRSINFINNNIYSLYSNFSGQTPAQPVQVVEEDSVIGQTQQMLNLAQITTTTDQTSDGQVFEVFFDIDTSNQANVSFPLSDENTGEAIMILKQRADLRIPNNIQNAPNGYDTLLTAKFANEDNTYEFTLNFENVFINLQRIMERMSEVDLEYVAFLNQIKVMYSVKPDLAGGCGDRMVCSKYKFQKETWHFRSPKSTNNNCSIMCYIKALKLKGNIVRADAVRQKCNIPLKTMIRVDQLHLLSDYFECGHIVYNGDDKLEIIDLYKSDRSKVVELVLISEHYMYVHGEPIVYQKCYNCGKTYRNSHTCNEASASYYQQHIDHEGKNWITNSLYKKKKEKINPDNIIFFDLECFPLGEGRQHTPYGVGWFNHSYKSSYGEKAFEEFIDEIMTEKGRILCAYNGAKYDFYPLMNALLKRGVKIDKHIIANGKILMLKFNGNTVFDLCQFTQDKLEKACKNFGCQATKSSFDHSKMKSWKDVNLYRNEVEPYMMNDVKCLKELFAVFNGIVHKLEGVNITSFVTLSHMAYEIWTNTAPNRVIEVFRELEKYDVVNQSSYGGRCYPLKKETKTLYFEEVMSKEIDFDKLYHLKQYINNADATSLYSASMKGTPMCPVKYPTGPSRWSENPEQDFKDEKLGVYYVKWDCPDKKLRVAVLPVRTGDGMLQTINGGEGYYTNIDIENALSCGYTFEFTGKALVWDSSSDTVFDEYVLKWFRIKQENSGKNGNKSLRKIAKLMLNALFGKMLQRVKSDGHQFCYNIKDIWAFRRKYQIKDWMFFDSDNGRCLRLEGNLHGEKVEANIRKPRQLGAFILAYSRRLMIYYMKQIDPSLHSTIFTYHDTDSLHITGEAHQMLVEKGLYKSEEEAELGLLCNDIEDEGLIIYEKNIASKNYMYKYINNKNEIETVMKCKGIPGEDKLGDNGVLYAPELWDKATPQELKFTSFEKVKIPNKKQSELGVEAFSIRTVEKTRTFTKNPYGRMIYKDGEWYPFGYSFD